MYATVRRIKAQPGRAAEVGQLIEAEYVPLAREIEGFVSYTLVDLGDDEVSSIGVFTDQAGAEAGNAAAAKWTKERFTPDLVAGPLEARAGHVLVLADLGDTP